MIFILILLFSITVNVLPVAIPGNFLSYFDLLFLNVKNFNQYNLNCLDPNDYPAIKLISHKDPITIKANVLKELINMKMSNTTINKYISIFVRTKYL